MPVWAKSTPSHLLTLQDPIVNQFLHYSPSSYTNITNPCMHACTYCFQYHMHEPLKAICAGFGWVQDTESGVVWVSFVRLYSKLLQDVHWIRNTYNYFTKTALLWHGLSFDPPSPSSNKVIYITVIFNCFSNVCLYILIITRSVNNPPLWRHSDIVIVVLK